MQKRKIENTIKTAIIIISLFFTSNLILGQKTIRTYYDIFETKVHKEYQIDGSGKYHGNYKIFNNKGGLYVTGNYKYGKLNGEIKTYFSGGKVQFIDTYKDGKKIGVQNEYAMDGPNYYIKTHRMLDSNGKLTKYYEYYQYKDKKADCDFNGTYKKYFGNGIKYAIGNHSDGRRIGEWLTFYSNGEIKYKDNYKEGFFLSRKEYNENNTLILDILRISDTMIIVKGYYNSGIIKYEQQRFSKSNCKIIPSNFESDIERGNIPNDGTIEQYFNSQLSCFYIFGTNKEYYKNGQLIKEGSLGSSVYKEYFENGQISKEINPVEKYTKTWYEDGSEKTIEITSKCENKKNKIDFSSFYKNGEQNEKGTFYQDDDKRTYIGKWSLFFNNGNKKSEIYYTENNDFNKKTEWFKDGKLKYEFVYEKDTSEIEYYTTGRIKSITTLSEDYNNTYFKLNQKKIALQKTLNIKPSTSLTDRKYRGRNTDDQTKKNQEIKFFTETGDIEKVVYVRNFESKYGKKYDNLSKDEYETILSDINQLKIEITELSLIKDYNKLCANLNPLIYRIESGFVKYKNNSYGSHDENKIKYKLRQQEFPTKIIHFSDIKSNFRTVKMSSDKEYIYNSYLYILDKYLYILSGINSVQDKTEKVMELNILLTKLTTLSSKNTKDLNKELKDVTNFDEAKKIIINY